MAAAAAFGLKFWWDNHRAEELKASVAAPVPSGRVISPTAPSTVAGESSKTASAQASPSPATTPTHPAPVVMPIIPNHVYIPAIGVNTTVSPKGTVMVLDEFTHKKEPSFGVPPTTPKGLLQTTWWSDGPRPGSGGMAIILGHSNVGIFDNLGKLKAGQVAKLTDGHILLVFRVIGKPHAGIKKSDPTALNDVLIAHPRGARAAFVTCSGSFNGSESVENTVVFFALSMVEVVGK